MSIQFYKLKVKEIRRETSECVSVLLDVPAEHKAKFAFTQGQYLTFKHPLLGDDVRRSYSICTSPAEGELRVAIKKLEGGIFSTFANEQLNVGDSLETMVPQGRFFTPIHGTHKKNYLAIAAGSGITPVISLVKTILVTEPESRVTLIYGNKTKGTIIFKSEIEALKNRHVDRLSVYHVLSRERGEAQFLSGRIDATKAEYFLDKIMAAETIDDCFLCGPEDMILGVKDALIKKASRPIAFILNFFSAIRLR